MKIYAESEDGTRLEIKEIETINKDCDVVLLMSDRLLRYEDIEQIEKHMTIKIGKQCVIIDGKFTKVLGV